MRINNWTIIYAFGYALVTIGIRTFYKRHQITGLEHFPKDKPIILACNHQNAFMDPVVVAAQLSKSVFYLVRADVFKKKWVARLFDRFNMMPIYRERDGVNTIQANEVVFNRCYDILAKKNPIIIFPEGTHSGIKKLRPLKKGFIRIAAGAAQKYGSKMDVQIIPIGVNYSESTKMGAELLINFGKPINASQFIEGGLTGMQMKAATDKLSDAMSDLMIDIQDPSHYYFIHEMLLLFEQEIMSIKAPLSNPSLWDKFQAQKQFINDTDNWLKKQDSKRLEEQMLEFKQDVLNSNLRYWLFKKEKHPVLVSIIGLILFFPVQIYGVINHYLPYKIPAVFVEKKVEDQQFHSSLKMALGVILFGVFWTIQIILVAFFTDHYIWLGYAFSLPLSALISYQYWIRLLKAKGTITYNRLMKKPTGQFKNMKRKYQGLRSCFYEIISNQ